MVRNALGVAVAALVVLVGAPVHAQTCNGTRMPTRRDRCQSGWLCTGDGWIEQYYDPSANASCSDGDACTTGDVCRGGTSCSGILTVVPGVPGPMTGPSGQNTTGSYAIGWGASTTCYPSRYELFEKGALVYSGTALTYSVGGKPDDTYGYQVRACNAAGCSAF